jgi:hypothetical protein
MNVVESPTNVLGARAGEFSVVLLGTVGLWIEVDDAELGVVVVTGDLTYGGDGGLGERSASLDEIKCAHFSNRLLAGARAAGQNSAAALVLEVLERVLADAFGALRVLTANVQMERHRKIKQIDVSVR